MKSLENTCHTYLSASAVVIHYEEALYQVYAPLPLHSFLFGVHCVEEGDRAFFRCRAMDRRSNRKTLVSWVMTVMRLPISWTSPIVMSSHVPAIIIIIIIMPKASPIPRARKKIG